MGYIQQSTRIEKTLTKYPQMAATASFKWELANYRVNENTYEIVTYLNPITNETCEDWVLLNEQKIGFLSPTKKIDKNPELTKKQIENIAYISDLFA